MNENNLSGLKAGLLLLYVMQLVLIVLVCFSINSKPGTSMPILLSMMVMGPMIPLFVNILALFKSHKQKFETLENQIAELTAQLKNDDIAASVE